MAAEAGKTHWLCEERYGKVVSFKSKNQSERISRFLKSTARNSSETERVSIRAPLLFEEIPRRSKSKKWPPDVKCAGWACSREKWNKWVENLAVEYFSLWNQSGICDAIMSSCFEIRPHKEIILGLIEFWCSETNTFVFPWGEATITLEDVMILGGFSVLGESVKKPVTDPVLEMAVNAMKERKSAMGRERAKKASPGPWMKYFMENDSEFEHVAFLSYWLSRYVFPIEARDTISTDVFPIAAHLSQGTPIALAPAVLASIYKNLRMLKEQVLSFPDEITVFAPFQLVLMWVYEHFPRLVLSPPNILKPGEPRISRWQKLSFTIHRSDVSAVFNSRNSFQWRPYAAEISNWNHKSYYMVRKKHLLIDNERDSDRELQSYAICLQMSNLVGLDCNERYMPYRVAMQFGMDQDLPGEFSGLDIVNENVIFFVPPRAFEPGVSVRYFDWWKNSEFFCKGTAPDILSDTSATFQNPSAEGGLSPKNDNVIVIDVKDDGPEFYECNDSFDSLIKSACKSDFPNREAESLERGSPSIEEVKGGGDCYASAESSSSRDHKSLTQSSAGIKCHASVTHQFPSIQRLQDSIEADHVALAENSKQIPENSKDVDENSSSDPISMSRRATSDEVYPNQDIRKRKFSTAMEETLHEATVSMTNGSKATTDVERRNLGIGHGNVAEESVQDVSAECKEGTAEVSFNGNMNVDDNSLLKRPATYEKCDLEKRIEKLEKLLGISPKFR